jgi:hypothetical protein
MLLVHLLTKQLTDGEFSGFQDFIKFTFDRKVEALASWLVGAAMV